MRTLEEVLQSTKLGRVAIGHFNISDSTQFNAIVVSAEKLSVPVLIGVSEGEKNFIGIHTAVALVRSAREQGSEVYVNLDHGHSVEDCKEAIDAGFDSVMFDGSKLSCEENIAKTKEVVEYARAVGAREGREVLVEGELGYIGSSSKMLDAVPSDVESAMTTPEQAKDFVEKTGVDILAPSVGNLHGMLKGRENPTLDIERIKQIAEAVPNTTLVLHGGSGLSDSDFAHAIKAGVSIVHINTEIRRAYRQGIAEALQSDTEQIAPYKYLQRGRELVSKIMHKRLRLFSNMVE